jgi:hypothetical protein
VRDGLGRLLGGVVWLAIILAIALGASGIVTGMDHPPGSAGRTDITFDGDAEVTARLDGAESDLVALAAQVESLGTQARGALAALNGSDAAASEQAIAAGDRLVTDVIVRTATIRRELADIPYIGSPTAGLIVSDAVVARHAALVAALDATDGLDADWSRVTAGSVAAAKMSAYLAEHDRLIGEAAKKGRLAKYDAAIEFIDQAALQLAGAHDQRNDLVRTVDVTVLDEWLTRNENYDVALKNLYTEFKKVGKKVTAATRAAVKAELDARARLPPDTRGLVIIMADIGRAGMNGAVIDIEEARAKLADALEASQPAPSGAPGATSGS